MGIQEVAPIHIDDLFRFPRGTFKEVLMVTSYEKAECRMEARDNSLTSRYAQALPQLIAGWAVSIDGVGSDRRWIIEEFATRDEPSTYEKTIYVKLVSYRPLKEERPIRSPANPEVTIYRESQGSLPEPIQVATIRKIRLE